MDEGFNRVRVVEIQKTEGRHVERRWEPLL